MLSDAERFADDYTAVHEAQESETGRFRITKEQVNIN